MKRVCVFCGSSMGSRPAYKLAAQANPDSLIDLLANYRSQDFDKWSDRIDIKP